MASHADLGILLGVNLLVLGWCQAVFIRVRHYLTPTAFYTTLVMYQCSRHTMSFCYTVELCTHPLSHCLGLG
jgi:hypothetical protein